jgi:hypothetical protein
VVAAEGEGDLAEFEGLEHQLGLGFARLSNLFEVLGAGISLGLRFQHGDGDVAGVFDVVAEGLELGFETRHAHGGRAHVDAAARLAEIERHADDSDVLGFDVLQRLGDGTGGHRRSS